jgi:tRNA G26 N,N-dimethylase Trm1
MKQILHIILFNLCFTHPKTCAQENVMSNCEFCYQFVFKISGKVWNARLESEGAAA